MLDVVAFFLILVPCGFLVWGLVIGIFYVTFFADGPCSGLTKSIARLFKRGA